MSDYNGQVVILCDNGADIRDGKALQKLMKYSESCPECDMAGSLVRCGRCLTCSDCGWSACSR